MRSLIEDEDRIYVLEEIEAKRNVSPKASRKANELIIFGCLCFAKEIDSGTHRTSKENS